MALPAELHRRLDTLTADRISGSVVLRYNAGRLMSYEIIEQHRIEAKAKHGTPIR